MKRDPERRGHVTVRCASLDRRSSGRASNRSLDAVVRRRRRPLGPPPLAAGPRRVNPRSNSTTRNGFPRAPAASSIRPSVGLGVEDVSHDRRHRPSPKGVQPQPSRPVALQPGHGLTHRDALLAGAWPESTGRGSGQPRGNVESTLAVPGSAHCRSSSSSANGASTAADSTLPGDHGASNSADPHRPWPLDAVEMTERRVQRRRQQRCERHRLLTLDASPNNTPTPARTAMSRASVNRLLLPIPGGPSTSSTPPPPPRWMTVRQRSRCSS